MNSLTNYIISEKINNEYILENNIQHIDSALNKVNVYIRNYQNNYIIEGFRAGQYDILFNINEKIAISNFLYQITEHYMHALMVENGLIDENLNEGLGDVVKNTKQFLAKRAEKISDKMKFLKDKLTTLYNFLTDISKGTINSIKDLCNKFIGMMIKFGCSVSELIEKFKADKKAAQSELFSRIKKILGLEKLLKKLKNVFGGDNELNKEIKESEEDKKSKEDNEYDYAAQAKAEYSKKSWSGLLGNVLMNVLINTIAHVIICIIIPAFATIIGGPIAGALTEGICKLAWGSSAFWKLCENHHKLINSSEYKNKYTKFQKTFTWIVFGIMVIWAISKIWTGVEQLYDCWEKWANGLADTILPSVNVQNMTKWINDIYKSFTGKDTVGYEEMQKAVDTLYGHVANSTDIKQEQVGSNKEDVQNKFEKTNYKSSTAAIEDMQKHSLSADQISNIKDNDQVTIFLNGYFDPKSNKWSAEMINKLVEKTGMPKEELMKILSDSHSLNKHLNGICARAGSGFVINAPGNVAKAIQDISTANGIKPILLGFTRDSVEIVQHLIAGSGQIGSFNWFDAFGPIVYNKEWFGKNNKSNNYFLLRIGAKDEQIYDICEVKPFKYDDTQKEFEKLNKDAFKVSENILKDNENSVNALIYKDKDTTNESLFNNYNTYINEQDEDDSNNQTESSESSNNTSNNQDATNIANKKLKILEKTKNDEIILVLYGKPWKIPNESKNESYNLFDYSCNEYVYEEESQEENKDKLVPVVLFNSLNMCFIDLVPQTEGGELRKNPSWLKGLQGAYQVLPKENGMSMEEISEFFSELIYNSFMRCYNINMIPPIIKTGKLKKHWEINPNAPDGERLDFGRFTNKECLEIVQSKGKPASKFLGANLFKSFDGQKTTEQDPKKREKALDDTAKTMKTNPKVKKVLDKHPNLKKNLIKSDGEVDIEELDKIFNAINRIEQSYDPKKPNGLFARIKSLFKKLFGKEDKETAKKYKPKEIKDLAFALKSAEADNKKSEKEVKDSFEGDFRYWDVFEMANFETAMKICMDEYEEPEEKENINENIKYYNLALYIKRN